MPIETLPSDCSAEAVSGALARDGCVVIEALATRDAMDQVGREMAPHIESTPLGRESFVGRQTRRTGGLIPRAPASHALLEHPLVLDAVGQVLAHATTFRLHLTQVISIGPGETAQPVHRDQWAFDFFPFPRGYEVQCNTLWAMTDFVEDNGATRVIPGSHLYDDKLEFSAEDTECVEMARGSVLLYTGSLYHGGGANRSDGVRTGLNLTYAVSWLRQEENQYLTTPLEVARELPDDLLRLMGYQRGAYALGYVDDLRDPLHVLRGANGSSGLGDLPSATSKLRRS